MLLFHHWMFRKSANYSLACSCSLFKYLCWRYCSILFSRFRMEFQFLMWCNRLPPLCLQGLLFIGGHMEKPWVANSSRDGEEVATLRHRGQRGRYLSHNWILKLGRGRLRCMLMLPLPSTLKFLIISVSLPTAGLAQLDFPRKFWVKITDIWT